MRNRISRILFIQLISIILIIIGTCEVYGDSYQTVNNFSPPAEVHGGRMPSGGQSFCAQHFAQLGGATTYHKYGPYDLPQGLAYAYSHGMSDGAFQQLVWNNQGTINPYASVNNLQTNKNYIKGLFAYSYEYANLENSFTSNRAVLLGSSFNMSLEGMEEVVEAQINIDMETFKSYKQFLTVEAIVDVVGKRGTTSSKKLIGIIENWKNDTEYPDDYYNDYMDKLDEFKNIEYIFANVVNAGAVRRDDEEGMISETEWEILEEQVEAVRNSRVSIESSRGQLDDIQDKLEALSETAQTFSDRLSGSFETIKEKIQAELGVTEEDLDIAGVGEAFGSFYEDNKNDGYFAMNSSMYIELDLEQKDEEDVNNVVKLERDGADYILGPYSLTYTDGGIGSDFADVVSVKATQYTEKGGEVIR